MSRFVAPVETRIALSGGDWITVKRKLTVGEERDVMNANVGIVDADGGRRPDFRNLGIMEVCAYLLDWGGPGFCDEKGKPVPIEGDAARLAAIRSLDPDSFREIDKAIDTHKAAVAKEDDAAKKSRAGGSGSS